MIVDMATSPLGQLSGRHWRRPGKVKLEVHNEVRVSESVAVLIPWIEEVPFDPAPWVIQGWENVWSAKDIDKAGFVPTVNQAMGYIPTEWTLIWNSDAWPQFTQQDLELALKALPPEVAIAAPIAEPSDRAEQITGERIPGRRFMYWNVTDLGPLAVSMGPTATNGIPYASVHGTAYAPLYAVRTWYFRNVGGLSPLYGPGYFDDAHFWRLARRMGRGTVVLPQLEYRHEGRKSFKEVWSEADLAALQAENLHRYLLSWGAIECPQRAFGALENEILKEVSKHPVQAGDASILSTLASTGGAYPTRSVGEALGRSPGARKKAKAGKA